uniref:ORF28 n=1 Tax=Nitrosopumilaceae spindle-shaped virus TaxID=3065433 RepID=A0AAT9JG61_9VIRU
MSERTHTHLFEQDSTTEPIDSQINMYGYENSCKPIQVSMVNYTMSSTLTVLVIFEAIKRTGDGFD